MMRCSHIILSRMATITVKQAMKQKHIMKTPYLVFSLLNIMGRKGETEFKMTGFSSNLLIRLTLRGGKKLYPKI